MRKNRVNNRLYIVFLLLIVIVNFMYVFLTSPLKVETIPVKFIVGNKLGIDLNSSELNYGIVLKGNSGVRNLIIENKFPFPVIVTIYVSKEISNYIYTDKQTIINENEQMKLPIILRVPGNAEFGNYTGKIKIEFRKK